MRFLGIDYGTKRIGIAISDEEGKFAFPKEIIVNDKNALEKVGKILETENVRQVVLGESLDFKGKENAVAADAQKFGNELEIKFQAKVHKEKEFLTTVEARRYGEESVKVDASAAALILQRYLDRINKQ